jgi:phosphoglucosamine mutase
MGRYFGTDGIRGAATAEVFQPPFLSRLAKALRSFLEQRGEDGGLTVVVGRDSRASGERIGRLLGQALRANGFSVRMAGVAPTPAVAKAVIDLDASLGIVVTASHNPASDNGIKLFARGGTKYAAEAEGILEDLIEAALPEPIPTSDGLERYDAAGAYTDFARGLLPAGSLRGWKIVVDCAHGATTGTTPAILRDLGAEVVSLGVEPDGGNINDGVGSEHPELLAARVRAEGASLGLAHDGDGDRLILVDESGAVVPGDAVLGLLGKYLAQAGALPAETIVATVMSNLGLDRAMATVGGRVVRTPVGDREVFQAMRAGGFAFGGESSGHLIVRSLLPTGDGLVAALQVFAALRASGESLSTLWGRIPLFPQCLRNLPVEEKLPFEAVPGFDAGLRAIGTALGERGRILVRYSGTETKLRLLAEAESSTLVEEVLARLEALARAHLPVR